MTFADWTYSGNGTGALNTSVKHTGNSSYLSSASPWANTSLTHNTFLEPQAYVIFWARLNGLSTDNVKSRLNHSSYGYLTFQSTSMNTFEKFEGVFWYDAINNIKFGRIYRWIGGVRVQYESDINFGAGSPAAGSIALGHWANRDDTKIYFDDVEVYS
ncbi:MAG: hypothetical protein JRE23_08115 [Deltaproteobacteria bacterium]|nr:hypothetical protein [Deltaproteobacteria bacterium]